MPYYAGIIMQAELSAGVWSDITADILQAPGISGQQGIMGNNPLDRVAETGVMKFTLRNDAGCSGGVANYYTPGHINCRPGWQAGVKVRLHLKYEYITKREFYGTVSDIVIMPGLYTNSVRVEVLDFMEQLAIHEMYLPEFTENKSMDEVIPLIVANLPTPPLSVDYGSSEVVFSTVFDTVRPQTRALSELNKLAVSELGFVYVKPGKTSDEVLVSEGLLTRGNKTDPSQYEIYDFSEIELLTENGDDLLQEDGDTLLLDIAATLGDAVFDNSMSEIKISHARNYYNQVKVIIYPREVIEDAILFSNQKPFKVSAGEIKTLRATYKDPNNRATSVSGIDMLNPVATTHYLFNEQEDGLGANLTANLSVVATYGTNGVDYLIENTGVSDGYVTKLEAQGKGILIYEPVIGFFEDNALKQIDGSKLLTLDMKYRDIPAGADDIARSFLQKYSQKDTIVDEITFIANRSEFLLSCFMSLHTGDKILIKNDAAGVNAEYFINGRKWNISRGGLVRCTYVVSPANYDSYIFWELGIEDRSELGISTVLGF